MQVHSFLQTNTLSCFTNLLPDQLIRDGQWEVEFSKTVNASKYQKVTERNIMFFIEKELRSRLNFFIRNSDCKHLLRILSKPWTRSLKGGKTTERVFYQSKEYLEANKEFWFAWQTKNLVLHLLAWTLFTSLQARLTIKWRQRKRPYEPELAYDIVRIHSHGIHRSDWLQHCRGHKNSFVALLSFISNPKPVYIITTPKYITYQTISNLRFQPVLKSFFSHSPQWLERHERRKNTSVSVGFTRLVLIFRSASNIQF